MDRGSCIIHHVRIAQVSACVQSAHNVMRFHASRRDRPDIRIFLFLFPSRLYPIASIILLLFYNNCAYR